MITPSLEDLKRRAGRGNLIPVVEEIHFDCETPISAFRKIDDGKFSFLLESVQGIEKWRRYSFLGSNPSHLFRSKGDQFEILLRAEVIRRGKEKDPLRALEGFLKTYGDWLRDFNSRTGPGHQPICRRRDCRKCNSQYHKRKP